MITVDGSQGEGGGQILRTSLALALLTGQPFRIERIRARRPRPGLMRQHLTAVQAAAEVGRAELHGAEIGSLELTFAPGAVRPGDYRFAVGSAGSTTLVLQTVLPPLLCSPGPSTLHLEGGTHNPYAPPFESLQRTFLPLLARMGPQVSATLVRPGFYPAGGGLIDVHIEPSPRLAPLELLERGTVRRIRATAVVSRLPRSIAERELHRIGERLRLEPANLHAVEVQDALGPGNVVWIEIEAEKVTEVFTGFGERGVRTEAVADAVAHRAQRYLDADVPVGPHLADQLLLPLALARCGAFRTSALTAHAQTNLDVIHRFPGPRFAVELQGGGVLVRVIQDR